MMNIKNVWHVALVTEQIDECTRRMWNDLGIGPWHYVLFAFPKEHSRVDGKNVDFQVSAAITQVGFLALGYDQPLTVPNPYAAMLRARGGGAHHLAFEIDDEEEARAYMRQVGYRELLAADRIGPAGEGAAGYFDAVDELGTVIELSKVPKELPSVQRVFPAASDAARSGGITVLGTSHVVIATHDAERVAQRFQQILGLGPWAMSERTLRGDHRGSRVQHEIRQASIKVGDFNLVIEQPLNGSGPLREFLDAYGQGIHRIAFSVDDVPASARELRRLGHEQIWLGDADGPGTAAPSAWFDTDRAFGTRIELVAR